MTRRQINIELVNRLPRGSYQIDRRRLIELAQHVLAAEKVRAAEAEIAVVSDTEMAELNQHYLNHRGPTDVLSFNLSGTVPFSGRLEKGTVPLLVGQIIVSADTARRQAGELGHPIIAELGLYIAHGLLHLLGYDDLDEPARQRMHARQRELVKQFGFRLKG